jgi:type II secretory pathway predicted ATPase ExeA
MAAPQVRSISNRGQGAMVATLRSPRPFAEDESGFGYFRSDHHHRFLAAAIARQLAKGHSFVLVVGEPGADGELIERFFAEQSEGRRPASLVRCLPQMNFRDIVRAYNRKLGLSQEADSGGLWTLLAHLMLEARNGISRVLMLDGAEALDLRSFEELQRFSQLDGPHVMPVVLLTGRDGAERLEAPPLEFLTSAMAARVEVEWLDPEEVGAFIQYQLNAASEADAALISPATVSAIAAACGGSPAEVNRLVREVLAASVRERDHDLSAPYPAAMETSEDGARADAATAEGATAEQPPEDGETPHGELEESAPAEKPPAVVVPIANRLPAAARAVPRRRNRRLFRGLMIVVYLAIATLLGQGLLYLLAPPHALHEPPSAIVAAVPPLPPAVPAPSAPEAVAESPSANDDDIPQSGGEAPTSTDAAQAAALAPAAGPPPPDAATPVRRDEIDAAAPPPQAVAPPPPPAAAPPPPAAAPPPPAAAPPPPEVAAPVAPAAAAPLPQQAALAPPPKAIDEAQPGPAPAPAPPVESAPGPGAAPPVDAASTAETAVMVRRAGELLVAGDVVSARRFFERAARAGDPAAECGLAKSYDPLYLRQIGARGPAGDAAVAIDWYRRAAAAGSVEAIARLERLRATPP